MSKRTKTDVDDERAETTNQHLPEHVAESPKDGGQTNQPFEQDHKRRLGHFGGAGEAPIKQPGKRQ